MKLRVKLLTDSAKPPMRADAGAAGYDLRADFADMAGMEIPSGDRAVIPTGIAVAIPDGCYGRIAPRSGLAARYGIDVLAGVVDGSYRGELLVLLLNTGVSPATIMHGDRIAQLIIERCETPAVELVDDLDETERGAGGFGSTGQR
jgi:dUTP pyrophosphatase